ncbi:hypothetical protein PPO43_15240 [Saprospira sp. CCB-QB6]|nr:hypothetical protein [Saprospira sp. CCB-QB6]WCL83081.1 hypothetical protein PPO43_15240 [Saprospira sp. CCB-QB6]
MLWGSQVCSALQATLRFAFGLAFGHPSAALILRPNSLRSSACKGAKLAFFWAANLCVALNINNL